jgi:hypothetical protein
MVFCSTGQRSGLELPHFVSKGAPMTDTDWVLICAKDLTQDRHLVLYGFWAKLLSHGLLKYLQIGVEKHTSLTHSP